MNVNPGALREDYVTTDFQVRKAFGNRGMNQLSAGQNSARGLVMAAKQANCIDLAGRTATVSRLFTAATALFLPYRETMDGLGKFPPACAPSGKLFAGASRSVSLETVPRYHLVLASTAEII